MSGVRSIKDRDLYLLKERLSKDFPGTFTVVPPDLMERLQKLPLPKDEKQALILEISSLDDDQIHNLILELEKFV
ncbi:MAG TPA: hypothetical protein VMV49_06575 [Candidatus Deferrimicrobium sp.]|nr:hypothetical protein [Candidatus Deferrimicrobium sp.]